MSKNFVDNILQQETTRRSFLKTAARGTAALAVGATLLNLAGCSAKDPREELGQLTGIPLPQGMLKVNSHRCIGCGRCELACSLALAQTNSPAASAIRVDSGLQFGMEGPALNYRYGKGVLGSGSIDPAVCRQCRSPICANLCPQQAILPDKETGARTVDPSKCDGCGVCVQACPWKAIHMGPGGVAVKCVTCGQCVDACPTGALELADWQDV